MVDANATRACVVCGVLFPRDGKRVACSDVCMVERRKLHQAKSNAKKRQAVVRRCQWCAVEFIKGPGTAAKYCCSDHAAMAKAKRDAARKVTPDVRARANDRQRRQRELNPLTPEQARRYAERKRERRALHGRGDRSAEYKAKTAHRVAAIAPSLLWIDVSYYMAHTEALAINAGIDRAARDSLKVERDKQDALRIERAKKRGLAASTLKLKEDPEKYAAALTKWRAKSLKRKTGQAMRSDGTANASVILGGKRCLYCDCTLHEKNRTHDHMRPLSRGGVHSAANIAPCCLDCNSGKGSMLFDKWIARLAPNHRARAIAYFEKRNGSIGQGGLVLAA